jgi:hypothetical protein
MKTCRTAFLFAPIMILSATIGALAQATSDIKQQFGDRLWTFMHQFQGAGFGKMISLGDEAAFKTALNATNLTIEIDPKFDKQAKFYPPRRGGVTTFPRGIT